MSIQWKTWTVPGAPAAEVYTATGAAAEGEKVTQGVGWRCVNDDRPDPVQTTLAIIKPGAIGHLEEIRADAEMAGFEV